MPIYAYKCSACGHAKDVLQKISDDPLTLCPACGAGTFTKQLTAAGFQLKGSGWYATDFKGGSAAPVPATGDSAPAPAGGSEGASPGGSAPSGDAAGAASSATSTAPAASSAAACGTSCACH